MHYFEPLGHQNINLKQHEFGFSLNFVRNIFQMLEASIKLPTRNRLIKSISIFILFNITILLIFSSIAAVATRPLSTRYSKSDHVPVFRNEAYSGPSRHGRGH